MASDPTFRSYKPEQAQQYVGARPAYQPALYEHIFAEHQASGGGFGFVVDVGCGPGRATQDLARTFDHAVGLDAGEGMINVARQRGGETKIGEKIRFEVCEAERIANVPGLPLGEVDMITAATAAHWFDMPLFWSQAAQLLRPGGTVAIWCKGPHFPHPSTPYATPATNLLHAFHAATLPYKLPGNILAQNMYDDLPLPWSPLSSSSSSSPSTQKAFPPSQFRRWEWDRDGILSDGKDFFGGSEEVPIAAVERALGTMSAVTRWREGNPELVGTGREGDVVGRLVEGLRGVVGERGVLRGGAGTVVLMLKKGGGEGEGQVGGSG